MAIDPRIRARRVAVHRAEGRRRLRVFVGAATIIALVVGAWALSRSPLLDLDHVRVDGVAGDRRTVVETAAALEPGTPLVDLDLGAVTTEVEALPWVQSASATREWPGTVRLTVRSREPVARLGRSPAGEAGTEEDAPNDATVLVDAEGVVIGAAPTDSDLPLIDVTPTAALGEVEPTVAGAIDVATALPEDLRVWVESITIRDRAGSDDRPIVGLELIGEAVVALGTPELIADKLEAVRSVLAGAELACIVEIDAAVADLVTVERDPVCDGRGAESEAADGG